ncbi:MAG: hypothetical protein HC877_05560 [Thioploca sp.]|nr:hypothetical protein [Thioploca sp.]
MNRLLKKTILIITLILLIAPLIFFLAVKGIFKLPTANPFEQEDICFLESYSGATSRFTVYTPVRCSDKTKKIGTDFGADFATLNFKDIDEDNIPEMIISSSKFRCKYSFGPCYDAYYIVIKIYPKSTPIFRVLEKRYLKELTPKCSLLIKI